ncbi:hypothetical protein NIES2119_16845 [[Phormidium ambiguum] IAM M-71]|uniref:Uncharacterized protein n=1 Tax=[Phormidium ambiguum] IAM M-71 TaxID=454136 RepID=A0A1U7IHS9_9CYAN|nr:hypothetical protein [Phormidium ambiguum]OKH36692.1 hypothetical protein NIES2119_16845 [Phormidium ambiguum IAM M-71]
MKNYKSLVVALGALSVLVAATPGITQNSENAAPTIPGNRPNTTINVSKRSGNCPSNMNLWTSFRSYEGGGEHTVIADTSVVASAARLSNSGAKFVEFSAPLKSEFASCVGEATSDEEPIYRFRFGNQRVVFRMDLSSLRPGTLTRINYRGVVSSRPAIRWAIAD